MSASVADGPVGLWVTRAAFIHKIHRVRPPSGLLSGLIWFGSPVGSGLPSLGVAGEASGAVEQRDCAIWILVHLDGSP